MSRDITALFFGIGLMIGIALGAVGVLMLTYGVNPGCVS